ncbi:lysophospholipid acyltransferase family protein [Congregibacter litoralis]|uniref:Lauroyl/myristoyl acyltransferase n=1 Tax=Congregibacter litoralis KT71 TaxID=314285 RepID=A4AAF9_9GAMM|nr:lysophospholipid acyltransferase family protein [Congregibacter litoralis]EAQ97036.1 Lauroyl/myristoyl acyltransferase [Congregibacter litoralis KT71]
MTSPKASLQPTLWRVLDTVLRAAGWSTFLIVYGLCRYRTHLVSENLSHAFPNLNDAERRELSKKFYRFLANIAVQVAVARFLPSGYLRQRVLIKNPELLAKVTDDFSKQAVVLLIHQGNWEWVSLASSIHLPVRIDPVYKPLHSAFWDKYLLRTRSRFGASPIAMKDVGRNLLQRRREPRLVGLIADQAGNTQQGYWTTFMHRPAAFYRGAQKISGALNTPVVFAQCSTVGATQYQIEFIEMGVTRALNEEDQIVREFVAHAERSIREQPHTYLWSNRRWKQVPAEAE